MSALHWLIKNSELYKKLGIVVDNNWFREVTESTEDTVREFLEKNNVRTKTIQKMKSRNKIIPMKMTLKHPMTMILIIIVRQMLMIMLEI